MTLIQIVNMNERILELMKQADYPAPELALRAHKLAELIVQECIEHLESSVAVPNIEHSRTKTKCIRSIKEHFGVEE